MLIYEPPAHGALCCIIPTGGRQRQLYGSLGFKKKRISGFVGRSLDTGSQASDRLLGKVATVFQCLCNAAMEKLKMRCELPHPEGRGFLFHGQHLHHRDVM